MFIPSAQFRFRLRFVTSEGGDEGGSGGDNENGGDLGFPANTPVKEMTPEQQAAYYHHNSKKWEKKAKASLKNARPENFDQIVADAEAFRKQADASKTPDQKAIDDAAQAARAAAIDEFVPTLVRAEFSRRLPDLDDEQLDELLEDVAPATYFKDGAVDTERVERMAKRLAPKQQEQAGGDPAPARLNLGHVFGATSEPAKGSGSSLAEAEQRTLAKYQTNSK